MISKAIVVLGALAAGGAAWGMQTYVYEGWTPPATVRIKRAVRGGGGPSVAAAPADAPVPAAADPKDQKAVKPPAAPAKPVAPSAPVAPAAPPMKVRKITDMKLAVAAHAQDLTLPRFREVHVDAEGEMAWHGGDGKKVPFEGYKQLGADLRRFPDAFVIVPGPDTPWLQVRTMLLEGQFNLAWNAFLGVAKAGEPDVLRLLPIPQTQRPDEAPPEGNTFRIQMTSREGPVVLTVNDKQITAFPADLAEAWNAWAKANPELADTSVPESTKVVFEAPKGAPMSRVIEVIDVLRGVGIQSERIGGALPTRPRK